MGKKLDSAKNKKQSENIIITTALKELVTRKMNIITESGYSEWEEEIREAANNALKQIEGIVVPKGLPFDDEIDDCYMALVRLKKATDISKCIRILEKDENE